MVGFMMHCQIGNCTGLCLGLTSVDCSKLKHYNHHVVGCNWSVDKWEDWVGYGYSTIYLKNGQILSTAKSIYGEEIIYGELPVDPKAKKSSK